MNKVYLKRGLIFLGSLILLIILLFGAYLGYLFGSYSRIEDYKEVEFTNNTDATVDVLTEYKLLSYNMGCGIYTSDFDFFMDGGKKSKAESKERVLDTMDKIMTLIEDENPDMFLLQEVDTNSTRSRKVNEVEMLQNRFSFYNNLYCVNYHSSYLMYPLYSHFGFARSGIMTFSKYAYESAIRRSLPIETSFNKFFDLDRCYVKTYVKLANSDKHLVLYNMHLSAYSQDISIVNAQLKMVLNDMEEEYKLGNYCVCGGDFNKDLLIDSSKYFKIPYDDLTWAKPINMDLFKDYPSTKLVVPFDEENPIPTCRNADKAYHENQVVLTIDGFIVSSNVRVTYCNVIDNKFAYSDHNPVVLKFMLKQIV